MLKYVKAMYLEDMKNKNNINNYSKKCPVWGKKPNPKYKVFHLNVFYLKFFVQDVAGEAIFIYNLA